jgi:hypothetical protein
MAYLVKRMLQVFFVLGAASGLQGRASDDAVDANEPGLKACTASVDAVQAVRTLWVRLA